MYSTEYEQIEAHLTFPEDDSSDKTLVMAAVSVVLPWSTWPIVPTFMCGFVRSKAAFFAGAAYPRHWRDEEFIKHCVRGACKPKWGCRPSQYNEPRKSHKGQSIFGKKYLFEILVGWWCRGKGTARRWKVWWSSPKSEQLRKPWRPTFRTRSPQFWVLDLISNNGDKTWKI